MPQYSPWWQLPRRRTLSGSPPTQELGGSNSRVLSGHALKKEVPIIKREAQGLDCSDRQRGAAGLATIFILKNEIMKSLKPLNSCSTVLILLLIASWQSKQLSLCQMIIDQTSC